MMRRAIAAVCLCLLAGCGFRPLYGEGGGEAEAVVRDSFAGIEVAEPVDRLSQELRNELVGALTPRGLSDSPRYSLRFQLEEEVEGFAFRRDRAVTRERVKLDAEIVLVDLETDEPILRDSASAWAAYDVVQSDFSNVTARRDARSRAADQLAERIVSRLALYFRDEAP